MKRKRGRPKDSKNKPKMIDRPMLGNMQIAVQFQDCDTFCDCHKAMQGRKTVPMADFIFWVKRRYA